MNNLKKKHWETVYETKNPHEVSWTQDVPKTSLEFINFFHLKKSARILDVGGGDSKLVDHLLDQGFEDITVLDISSKALERAKKRLGKNANKVDWIVSDVTDFTPKRIFDVWHDRATFHFLTSDEEIVKYKRIIKNYVTGYLVIGTFSKNGPTKCSGLEVKQYDEEQLTLEFINDFKKISSIREDHITPFNTSQNFLFCSFKRIEP